MVEGLKLGGQLVQRGIIDQPAGKHLNLQSVFQGGTQLHARNRIQAVILEAFVGIDRLIVKLEYLFERGHDHGLDIQRD